MVDQWDFIQKRFDQINEELASADLPVSKRLVLQKELAPLTALIDQRNKVQTVQQEIDDIHQQMKQTTDTGMLELFQEELVMLNEQYDQEMKALDELLYPADELDKRDVYLEVRAGAGGQEAALFAADLLKMYKLYAEKQHWRASIESLSETDLGGMREAVLHITGRNVFGHLRYESGVHRVQRVPATETQGRVHTSTATVAVLPEAEEVDISINPADLRIDVYRASGAGGQHVNTTDSAVRITHIPTGVVVACQDERSQHKNKAKAMKMLQARLLASQVEQQQAEMSANRKKQVGTGMRAEKVRTYNYPQNRVTDHQANITLKNLDMVMQGNLDDIIDGLIAKERSERRAMPIQMAK